MKHLVVNRDEPIDCQIRGVGHDGYVADDGGEIQFKTHRYLPVPAMGHANASDEDTWTELRKKIRERFPGREEYPNE